MRKLRITLLDSRDVEAERRDFVVNVDEEHGSEDEATDDSATGDAVAAYVGDFVKNMTGAGLAWSVKAERL